MTSPPSTCASALCKYCSAGCYPTIRHYLISPTKSSNLNVASMGSNPADVASAVMGTQDVQRTAGRSKLYGLVHKLPAHTGWVRNPIQCSQYRSTRSREAGNMHGRQPANMVQD
ncbi:hypothetical protein J3E68DRAFT_391706 [Trichoderma sp. SZMC 28012]